MILNSADIIGRLNADNEDRLEVLPRPPDKDIARGASIDLRLGRWFRNMKQANLGLIDLGDEEIPSKEYFVPFDKHFVLHPSKFVLGITLEWLVFPGNLAGHVTGRSSLGRRGLIIETAAGIQPGYAGCLTLELANVGEIPILLRPGMPICQIFLHETMSSDASAVSQFKGGRKPELGKLTFKPLIPG